MSNQTAQRVRRNGSPSTTKQGPMKAVKAFSLKQGNSNSRTTSSPSPRDSHKPWSRKSPDHRLSPERKSPGGAHSPSQQSHKEKGKGPKPSPVPGKWRASSADTVVPSYLTGQWPKDINSYHHYQSDGVFMCDKSTQTVDDWEAKSEKKKKGHKRSASFGQGQKSKEGSKHCDGKQRSSPVPANHSALSLTAPPALCAQQTKAILVSAAPKHNMNRYQRNSVEGLNMEIEKLVSSVKLVNVAADGDDYDTVFRDIPDGHRAPIPELTRPSSTRSVDTQTPSGHLDHTLTTTTSHITIGRPASISPATLPRSGSVDIHYSSRSRSESTDSKSSKGDAETSPEPSSYLSSPKLEKSCPFVREPPDGCEKVTVVEESRQPQIKEPMLFKPVKPNQFVFKQSQGSAFCPLIKSYWPDNEFSLGYSGSASPVLSAGIDG